MRIGIDMLAVQSPGSRLRGIGRYGLNLVNAMLGMRTEHEYVLYTHSGFPSEHVPTSPNAKPTALAIETSRGERYLRDALNRLATENPDALDALVTISPFELCPGYDPPARPLNGPILTAVVHDLIPFLFQERYLGDEGNAAWFYRRLRTIRGYDLLLTNSDATRNDCLSMLNMPTRRVVTISGAADGRFFRPDDTWPMPSAASRALDKFGIRGPYVFCVNGMDDRKNVRGLVDGFRLLRTEMRESHQLVVTCHMRPDDEVKVRSYVRECGLTDRVVLTGEVDDDDLLVLYQRASVFAFPSLYEGLGLPLLEAMHCGVPVVAGANSSQIEVVGDAGILVNAADPSDISAAIAGLLSDRDAARRLGARGRERAAEFTWDRSAAKAIAAVEAVHESRAERRLRVDRGHRPARPRLAIFSPWPPKASGISNYAARLVEELRPRYAIDLYHEPGYVPEPALSNRDLGAYDWRLFARNARVIGYRGVLHQMGNSFYHAFIYEAIRRFPGIVTLHDFCLTGFQYWYAHSREGARENLREELRAGYPENWESLDGQVDAWRLETGGFQDAAARRGIWMNRSVFDRARSVVVHSPWCLDRAREVGDWAAQKTIVIPHGADAFELDPDRPVAIRERFGLPLDATLVTSFGILTQGKMNVEALESFARIADEFADALFVFVGQDWEDGLAARKAADLGIAHRTRFLGRKSAEEYADLLTVADVGVSLRRPPTYGETSGAMLDLLRHGIPTIVNDVATFSGYPDEVVRKVDLARDGTAGLAEAMRGLLRDRAERARLGEAARRYVATTHAWPVAADLYAELIERTYSEGRRYAGSVPPAESSYRRTR